ncbi:MAG: D-alanyl-D-alanine carboxypeptidase [Clostridia bacterium]|nr:D-alanyl-D-alanine carboxypeptidase [Clostridia bacterium]
MKTKAHEYAICAAAASVFSVIIYFYSALSAVPQVMSVPASAVSDVAVTDCPKTSAQAFALADVYSGEILHSLNGNSRLPMASTTKIMTALLIIENMDGEEQVKISREAVGVEGSSVYLAEGEVLTINELLYGLLLESGNDAATALAIACAGDTASFADMMNARAKEMGLCNTHFDNPHGLSSQGHYTTACELAKITAVAMRNERFREIVSTQKYNIAERENCRARYFSNHNRLLGNIISGDYMCNGVKTGYTEASGRCLVTSAGGECGRFVAVTLNDRNDWKDHSALLSFAFDNYKSVKIAKSGELSYSFKTLGVPTYHAELQNTEDIYITLPKDYDGEISVSAQMTRKSAENGATAGYMCVKAGDIERIFELNVTESRDVKVYE